MAHADIGVTGLGVMGRNLARNFAHHGFTVAVHNRTLETMRSFLDDHGEEGTFVGCESDAAFVEALAKPRTVVIMVPAGGPTDSVIDALSPLLEPGDILVDAGNAQFADTRRREAALAARRIHFVGTGVSGGEEGALNGPSIMPGGSAEAYATLGPILEKISAHVDGEPCCAHVGPDGAGHFVKMVHNGIEYADMQLIAEAYDLLRSGLGLAPAEIGDVFAEWNTGELESYLIEITAEVLRHTDAATGLPLVDVILDEAGQKGTGRWTVETALELGVPVTGIAEATFARAVSAQRAQRDAARGVLAVRDPRDGHPGSRRLHRGRSPRAVRVQGGGVRPGVRRDSCGLRGLRLGDRSRRHGAHLARGLHHPCPVPWPDHRGVRAGP